MAKRFTKEELDNIINDYANGNGLKPFELGKKYDREPSTIRNKLKDLGIYKDVFYRFTNDDIVFLKEYYPTGDWDLLLNHFPKTTKQSIMTKASKLGIKMLNESAWSNEEENIIKSHYSTDIELTKKLLPNRSYKSITTKAKRLGVYRREFWTQEEESLLIKLYPKMSVDDVLTYFPNRSRTSIIAHAIHLNINSYDYNPWTSEEDEYIINHWQYEPDTIMCKKLGRTYKATQARRLSLDLLHFNKDGSGYENLSKYLRGHLQSWKDKSMKNCDYKCIFTGSKDFEIHHIYGFSNIVNETIEEFNIPVKSYEEYESSELEDILNKFLVVHDRYPLGVCIRKDIHILYHSIYSKCINNENQWKQFVEEYNTGMYDSILKAS